MRIVKIDLLLLRNEAHYCFLTFFQELLLRHQSVLDEIIVDYDKFSVLLVQESQLVDAMRSSGITKELAAADRQIGRIVVGINSCIRAGLHHFDPDIVQAARAIYERMKVFGNIEGKSYEEESAAVVLLIADLKANYSTQMEMLTIDDWIFELSNAEDEFNRLFALRNTQRAEKPEVKLKDIRKAIDVVYRQMIDHINAMALINPTPDINTFIRQWNIEVEYAIEHNHH
jgi:hypothetical protein